MLALLGHLLVRLSEVQDKSSKLSRRRIMPNALIAGKPRGGGAWDGKNVDVFHNGLSSPTESCLRSAMYFKWTPQSFRTVLKRPESTVLVLKALCSSFQRSSRLGSVSKCTMKSVTIPFPFLPGKRGGKRRVTTLWAVTLGSGTIAVLSSHSSLLYVGVVLEFQLKWIEARFCSIFRVLLVYNVEDSAMVCRVCVGCCNRSICSTSKFDRFCN